MKAVKALLEAGQLRAAIDEAVHGVKVQPADQQRRMMLFELLCFAGDFDRALRQLDVIGGQSAETEIGAQVYRQVIQAERARQSFFAGGEPPVFLAEPPDYIALHLQAVRHLALNNLAETAALLVEAEEVRPALAGQINGEPFADFRNYDDFTAPLIELLWQGEYVWLPLTELRCLEVEPPRYLRDLLWLPARFETRSGGKGECCLPALYAGSSAHEDDAVRLGRMTVWRELTEGLFAAAGRHIWLADEREVELPEVRTLEFASG